MSSKKSLAGAVVAALVILASVTWWLTRPDDQQAAAPDSPTTVPSEPVTTGEPTAEVTDRAPSPKPVEPKPVERKRSFTDPAPLAEGAEATVTKIESVVSEAEIPGEISAPALRFTIKATAGDAPLDLAPVVVNVYFGSERTPAIAMGAPGAKPLEGRVKPGASATGVYVFNVPPADRDLVRLEFSWSPKEKAVVLTGNVT